MATKYTVKKGDTLWGIANRFYGDGTHLNKIKEANNLKSDTIHPNDVLVIPSLTRGYSDSEIVKQLKTALADVEKLPSVIRLREMLED